MKYLLVAIVTAISLQAEENAADRTWIESIIEVLLEQKEASVYAAGEHSVALVESSDLLRKKHDCMTAEIILADDDLALSNFCKSQDNRILYRSYRAMKNDPFALGAAYLHKGRRNLLLNKSRIDYFGIELPHTHRRYLEAK